MDEDERNAEDRVQAVRVAIALRAALRADEDARCEEAYCVAYEAGLKCRSYTAAELVHEGAWRALSAIRGWPVERRDDAGRVPLALWEVER